jgi:curved DNA-binding protein CbpA
MSIASPFSQARAALGLGEAEDDPAAVKRAYRRALVANPPDGDQDAFRRIRDAYELLRDPWSRVDELLGSPLPQVPPPAPPAEPPLLPRGATALALLRLAAMRADTDKWAAPARASRPRRAPKKEEPT